MKFLEALSSTVFWFYAGSAAGVLAAAWGGLFWLRHKRRPTEKLLPLLAALTLFAGLVLAGVLLGREAFAFLVVMVSLLGCHEFARGTGLGSDWPFTALVYLAIPAVNAVALWAGYDAFMATPIYAVAVLCVLPVVRNRTEGMLPRLALAVMAFVYFSYFLAHLTMLAATPGGEEEIVGFLFFLLFGSALVGAAGDLADRYLGRHPLAPGIGPEKTWEGAVVSLAISFLWCFSVGWALESFPWPALLLSALVLWALGILGELVMRYALRDLRLAGPASPSPVDPVLALWQLSRLIFAAPVFFRLVHFFAGLR
jgi:phosphatidate cytidylyltransferase